MTESGRGPVARVSSPPPPLGDHDLTSTPGQRPAVAVDTNTLLDGNYRLPLAASARGGDLVVYRSPSIVRECVKVIYRETMRTALRGIDSRRVELRPLFDRTAADLESQLFDLEAIFRYPAGLHDIDQSALASVSDPTDRHVLRTALAAQAPFLLSLDRRQFPHGSLLQGVRCWHPDSFLTLFYQQNPASYARARQRLDALPTSIRRRLLP